MHHLIVEKHILLYLNICWFSPCFTLFGSLEKHQTRKWRRSSLTRRRWSICRTYSTRCVLLALSTHSCTTLTKGFVLFIFFLYILANFLTISECKSHNLWKAKGRYKCLWITVFQMCLHFQLSAGTHGVYRVLWMVCTLLDSCLCCHSCS